MKKGLGLILVLVLGSWFLPETTEANCVIRDSNGRRIERGDCYGAMLDVEGGLIYARIGASDFGRLDWIEIFYTQDQCQGRPFFLNYRKTYDYLWEMVQWRDEQNLYFASLVEPAISGTEIKSISASYTNGCYTIGTGFDYNVDSLFFSPLDSRTLASFKLTPPFRIQ